MFELPSDCLKGLHEASTSGDLVINAAVLDWIMYGYATLQMRTEGLVSTLGLSLTDKGQKAVQAS